MQIISCKIDRGKAAEKLRTGLLLKKKNADKVELLHLGFHLLKVTVDPLNSNPKSEYVLVDVLTGAFSFLDQSIDYHPADQNITFPKFRIQQEQAKSIAKREYSYHLLHRNLRTKLSARISNVAAEATLLYPFWIGYFIHKNLYSLSVIDGVTGKKQSGAIKNAIINHLAWEFENLAGVKRTQPDIAHSSGK